MTDSLDPGKALESLIEHFEQNLYTLKSPQYNEAQVRLEFINPFFALLGWDMDNRQGYAEAYKDVIHEDAIKVGGYTKAPDYCFRIGGTRKFFVEAKKPSVNIKDDPEPAYQLRRYAWSAKLPLSILTDFEELAVYDCRSKPSPAEKPSIGRVRYYGYRDYPEKWEEIASVFSREAVLKGSFDKYAESEKAKRGTTEVDKAFLHEIEAWRDSLARNLALRNPSLSSRELNFAVQATIDRIIFLRICEDRGVEDYARLMALLNGEGVYKRLVELFRSADERYNSGLFHFAPEKGRAEAPDELTPRLIVDDKVLKEIVRSLYYPESPYEFSVLPADILGQVYEQFLGKVIRLTAGHQAKVEDKPEVKKAGGVYYTPTYIVDYIVKNTVGKMLEGKTPKEISGETPKGAHPLRVADIACGSGSFLLGAYQYLMTWYRDRYIEEGPEKWAKGKEPRLYQAAGGEWKLTTSERKRILLNHIYGVDIDSQAVEVTKLSLLLKVLEGETKESVSYQRRLFHERALPDLSRNIKCGNSLIGSDFYKGQQIALFDEEERTRINAFDWDLEFPEVFGKGKDKVFTAKNAKDAKEKEGFDVVIGNPPYIQLSMADYFNADINTYLLSHYSSSMGRLNTFGFFAERAASRLLSSGGFLSFIVPNTLLTQAYYQPIRQLMLQKRLICLTAFRYPVFARAVVETIVFVLQSCTPNGNLVSLVDYDNKVHSSQKQNLEQTYYNGTFANSFLLSVDQNALGLKQTMEKKGTPLHEFVNVNQAIALKEDRSRSLFKTKSGANYKKVLDGRNIGRYTIEWDGFYLAYDLSSIHSCKRTDIFECNEKLFFRRVGERLTATYDSESFYALNTLVVITLKPAIALSIKYILGLLNSRLLNHYYCHFLKSTKKVFSEIQARQLEQLPIVGNSDTNPSFLARHDQMVSLVDQMLSLHKQFQAARTEQDKTLLQRQITATDKEIDRLVYALYGLTDDEIAIVEGSS